MRSGGEGGQVWLSVRCGDGGKPSLSSWLIPTGAAVHSHCEMGLIAQMRTEGGSVWIRRVNGIGLKQHAIGCRKSFCKKKKIKRVRSTPTHYGNSQLLKADVWTNGCGERAAGTAEGHRVRPQDQGFFCVSWYDLFIPVILVSLDSSYFICPIKQFCKSQSLHRLCCH